MRLLLSQFFLVAMIIFLGIFSAPTKGYAQEFQIYSANDIFVETVPKVPGPNQQVSLKLTSYSFNLNNYYIAWFENGERKTASYGNREYKFTTGKSGEITNITAVVEFEGQVLRKELRFSPSNIDLLWEVSDGYAPPFYKGKVLPITQSKIKVTGIPETLLIEPNDAPNLVYYWDRNYERNAGASGFGKSSFQFTADPLLENEKITVTSNDRRENSFATNTIDIPTTTYQPKILFYEINDTGRLLTNRALNTHGVARSSESLKFSFHPLNFSTTQPNFTDLFVGWRINNELQPPQDFAKQNELFVSSGGETGTTTISVTLEGIQKLLQKRTEEINLTFN